MSPSVYLYNETDNGFELYFDECSTLEGLSLLDENAELCMIQFGATSYQKYGWATECDIPPLNIVRKAIDFLGSEGDIGIIEFKASIPGFGSFSTYDDRKCQFLIKSKHDCMSILGSVLPLQYKDKLIYSLTRNPGVYLTCSVTGRISKYSSLDEYIAKNA